MIRILYLLSKPKNMSKEQFDAECLRHFEMSEGIPGLHKYEVRLIASEPTDLHVPFFDVPGVDAIGECWFEMSNKCKLIWTLKFVKTGLNTARLSLAS